MNIETEVIVFDQGNTLIMDPFEKVLELKRDEFLNLFKKYGINIDIQKFIDAWKKSNNNIDYPYISHFCQEEPIIQDALKSLLPYISAFLKLELLLEYRKGAKKVIESDPRNIEVKKTLQTLKDRGQNLGVFSNERIIGLSMNLKWGGIEHYFGYIETSESIGIEKPDLRVFEHILNHYRIPASLITYVGDDPFKDIDPAKEKGLNAILHLTDKNRSKWRNLDVKPKYEPDAVIKNFSELSDIIN